MSKSNEFLEEEEEEGKKLREALKQALENVNKQLKNELATYNFFLENNTPINKDDIDDLDTRRKVSLFEDNKLIINKCNNGEDLSVIISDIFKADKGVFFQKSANHLDYQKEFSEFLKTIKVSNMDAIKQLFLNDIDFFSYFLEYYLPIQGNNYYNIPFGKEFFDIYINNIVGVVKQKFLSSTDEREKLKVLGVGISLDIFNVEEQNKFINYVLSSSKDKKATIKMMADILPIREFITVVKTNKNLTNDQLLPLYYKIQDITEHSSYSPINNHPILENIDFISRMDKANEVLSYRSMLKTALSSGKNELAIEMVKAGFTLREGEKEEARAQDILKSNNLILRMLGYSYTDNDKLRIAIMVNAKEKKDIILSNKPSPLYLAIETGQFDLAIALVEKGFELKKTELVMYNLAHKEKNLLSKVFSKKEGLFNENQKEKTLDYIESKRKEPKLR